MDSALGTVALPAALAVIMFGLGLSLTVDDFVRVTRRPRAAVVALTLQLLVLPAVCFGLVLAAGLEPVLAVGMVLLAASPGGTTANLISHLFRGDATLNVSLTAVNSLLAVVTLPLVIVETVLAEREDVAGYLREVGLVALAFCVLSLLLGFAVPRAVGVGHRQALACAFEIGVHNSTLAIAIAVGVLGSVELAVPAAVYGVLMFPVATLVGWAITRSARSREPVGA